MAWGDDERPCLTHWHIPPHFLKSNIPIIRLGSAIIRGMRRSQQKSSGKA